jgi:ribosomal protein S18 acetylase RimI-like enzyme
MADHAIAIRSVARIDAQDFIDGLNAAYEDYFVPIFITPDSFRDLIHRESIRLDASRAALDEGRVVGTGLLGVRGQRGWIGGMGVVPLYRRQGIARRLMEALIDQSQRLALRALQLEVITRNEAAYALYRSLGFTVRRELVVLSGTQSRSRTKPSGFAPDVTIEPERPAVLMASLRHLPAPPRPWQRDLDALRLILPELSGVAARDVEGHVVGVCLYRARDYQKDVYEVAALDERIGLAMTTYLFQRFAVSNFTYLNVVEDDPLLPALFKAGFEEVLRQYEMWLPLNPESPA